MKRSGWQWVGEDVHLLVSLRDFLCRDIWGGNNLRGSIFFLNILLDFPEMPWEELHRDGTMDMDGFVPPKIINDPSEAGKCDSNHLQLSEG